MTKVVVKDAGTFTCREGEDLLTAARRAGVGKLPVGCRGGGCGVCRIRVIRGRYAVGKMSVAHVSVDDRRAGYALACRLVPEDDLEVEIAGKAAIAPVR